ncbi:MAG: amylo-alpha-1,6-glucosidase [Phycisphaerales bacterium]
MSTWALWNVYAFDVKSLSTPIESVSLPIYQWSPKHRSPQSAEDPGIRYIPDTEWVLTMGNGSFAMGSIDGTIRRRYHGLLVSSLSPPVQRVNILPAMDECVRIQQEHCCTPHLDIHLTKFQFGNDQSPPPTMQGLVGFEKHHDRCVWTYHIPTQLGAISIRKTLTVAERANACLLTYEIQSPVDASMDVSPLIAMRDFHELDHPGSLAGAVFDITALDEPAIQGVHVQRGSLIVNLRGIQLDWKDAPTVYKNIKLDHETQRGQPDRQDLFRPGHWSIPIAKGLSQTFSIEISESGSPDWNADQQSKHNRMQSSIDHAIAQSANPSDPLVRDSIIKLACAADAYVVDRVSSLSSSTSSPTTSIIAGYPWFSDWGRDTMIALPGLLLTTGRHDEALDTLNTFAGAIADGLIPNRFDDAAGPAHYNTVDASLWFIHACAQWCSATNQALPAQLDDACNQIINAYTQGTIHNIAVDPIDGLVSAGSEETQLTWMDAQRNGVTFTPRHGKSIEINALWINALRAYASLINHDRSTIATTLRAQADLAQESIQRLMTKGPSGGLIDCLTPTNQTRSLQWDPSRELRPNQIFAISLPFVQLPLELRNQCIEAIWQQLITPAGVRTLAPTDSQYHPHYQGTLMERDAAYHNGTVWPWILGPACEALMRSRGFDRESRDTSIALLTGLTSAMDTDSVGQIHEIYDADPGKSQRTDGDQIGHHRPDGCPAQAWSIAETLRVLILASNPESESNQSESKYSSAQ